MATRRIDALFCTAATARQQITAKRAEVDANAEAARAAAQAGIDEMVAALQARREALMKDIGEAAAAKQAVLDQQLQSIEAGTSQPACVGADGVPLFRMDTDEVVHFRADAKELREKIEAFGLIDQTSTYSSESFVQGPIVDGPLKINNPFWLLIHSCDMYGQQRTRGGEQVDIVFSEMSHFDWKIEDLEDGRYKLFVTPLQIGVYTLEVFFSGELIRGGPFELRVFGPRNYKEIGENRLIQDGEAFINHLVTDLRRPLGMELDCKGRYIFVADQRNDRVQVLDVSSRQPVCSFGKKGWGQREFNNPAYIVVTRQQQIIVSDLLNHRLQVLQFDEQNCALHHVMTIGSEGTGEGQFTFPRGIVMTEDGLLVICDSGNHRIQILDSKKNFEFVRCFGEHGAEDGQLDEPLDVTINRRGEIIIVDASHAVKVYDMKGTFIWSFGKKGKKDGMLRHPTSVTVDDEDTLYVCDQGNHRVQVFRAAENTAKSYGWVHSWGGSKKKPAEGEGEEAPPEDDGRASPTPDELWSGMYQPAGIAVSPQGSIFVSDYHGNCIYDY